MAKEMTLEQKYRRAVQTLQAIAQCTGEGKYKGETYHDEWTDASAFWGCRNAAKAALEDLGEPTSLPNKREAEKRRAG